MDQEKLPADGAAINALATGLGAMVFAIVRRMPASDQAAFANDLAVMAQGQNDAGNTTSEKLLIDLHQAALRAGKAF